MRSSRHSRPRSVIAAAVLALAGLIVPSFATGQDVQSSAPPALDDSCPVELDGSAGCGTATPIEPDPAVLDPQPRPWERIEVAADGRSLAVTFWMGVEECFGLHSVEVTTRKGGVDLVLLTGTPPDAEGRICVALAQEYVTTVVLEEPLIGNVG